MGEEWKGGDIANSPGGAFKINLLRKEMENHKNDWDLIVLFSDSYDVVAVGRYGIHGDQAAWTKPPVDIDVKVAF